MSPAAAATTSTFPSGMGAAATARWPVGRQRGGGGEVPGGDSEVRPRGGGGDDPRDPDYMGPSRGTTAHLLPLRTKNRPAADLFCTRNRCVARIEANDFGEYMRGGSEKRQTVKLIKDHPKPVNSFG